MEHDKKLARQAYEMRTQGYTTEMWESAKFLQRVRRRTLFLDGSNPFLKAWYKKKEKAYYKILIKSLRIMKYAEEKYLNRPGVMTGNIRKSSF